MLDTVIRFDRTTTGSDYSAKVEFGAVYLTKPGTSRNAERSWYVENGYTVADLEDGSFAYETTWGMTAAVEVMDHGLGDRPDWRVKVSQSSIGSTDPDTAEDRARVLLMAIEAARVIQEDPAAFVAAHAGPGRKITETDLTSYEFRTLA